MTHGGCTTDMLKTESEIKSLRNQLKHQDVQENLVATG
jgi:Zn-dependent M16 (insulinase) family peptidase